MEKITEVFKKLGKPGKYIICGAVVAVLLAAVLLVVFSGSGDVTISIESSLKEIMATSTMRTAEYTYNSIADVMQNDTIKYHVSYKGTVTMGCDFEKIRIERDGKIIRVIVPDVEIQEVVVAPEMDFIFIKKKYDTETTYAEATAACKKDLRAKAEINETLRKTAREGAEDMLMALLKPFESQLENGEKFEVSFDTMKEEGAQ